MKNIGDLELGGKTVLIRADLNVPLDEEQKITDELRLKSFIPTLKFVLEAGGKPVVMSHLGRPGGQREAKYSLAPVAERMSSLIGKKVHLATDCVGDEVTKLVTEAAADEVVLLENLRFREEERSNDPKFSQQLADMADVFINDAFATSHRSHASMLGVAKCFSEKGIGFLMQKELEYFDRALKTPQRPLCVILGGAKVSSKFAAFENIADKADSVIIGGAMANTFLAAQGIQMGKSLYEADLFPKVLELMGMLARRGCKVYLPVDFIVSPSLNSSGLGRAVPSLEIPADSMALDIGPASRLLFAEAIQSAETIIWNGPMGAFEKEEFAEGTMKMVEAVANAHALSVVGGGDTDAAIHQMELAHKFDFISTGGGAFLSLLEGQTLPALKALES